MKKTIFSRTTLVVLLLLFGVLSFGQNFIPFTPRFDKTLKGDILLIGNNILSKNATSNYNTTGQANNNIDPMVNVDIDTDASTFNSSSADLAIPNPACYKIVYAGLYWSAVIKGSSAITDVKIKLPGAVAYSAVTGTQIYYQNAANNNNSNSYACYADVTSLVKGLTNPEGTYTVANVSTLTGNKPNTEGLSAGWSLFVVYEDPTLPSKYITSFDGYSRIDKNNPQNIPVSGFKTIPVGPVRAKYAFSAIEGDNPYSGDFLQINGATISATNNAGTAIRPANNFFNSTVSYISTATNTPELFTTRNPVSANTLGFDAGILSIPNAGNTVIKNGDTAATIRLGSTLDIYYFYFNAFAVDVIEPKIVLTKTVWDNSGVNIGNQNVVLGQQLNYVIGIQNKGNDNATSLTIRDRLPINVIFNYPADIVSLPSGVTVSSYNAATRDIIFNVNNSIVKVGDALKEIRFKVQVVPLCNMLSDACSNIIDNIAYATYKGTLNTTFTISDDPSFDVNTGCLLVPKATNFLVDIDNCLFTMNEVLCGTSVTLKAANGYSSYSWSSSPTGTPVIGTNQTLTVTAPGKYYVHNTAIAPCLSINQEVTVTSFGGTLTNPVIPFADEVVTCPNDLKKLPNIFLCGANAFKDIKTGISDGSVIVWEKLNEASCAAVVIANCANESNSCTWSQVGTGPNYQANASGQYRVTLNYAGGCFNRYYFNVYQNLLSPTVVTNDIICYTPGKITVGGVPTGYEYSLSSAGPWQASNVFAINTPNSYTVYIKQIGNAQNLCVFSVPNILIRKRDFTVTPVVTQPYCHGDKGAVILQINDVEPQYYVTVKQAGSSIFSSGPDASNTYHFNNLNPGTYDYTVTTDDGCTANLSVTIVEPATLTATSALTKPLTCTDGEITVTPKGGTPPYSYFVNSTTEFQGTPQIEVSNPLPAGGVYTIKVVDSNNCEATTSITVAASLPPVYTVTNTTSNCYNDTAQININVTNANGNSLLYSIDNGVTFGTNPTFSNLTQGTYNVVVKYGITYTPVGGSPTIEYCQDPAQVITITGPASAVSASAGVAELAGCSLPDGSGVYQGGKVRITNAQGGVAPYTYSFDGGISWQASNEKEVLPGTYILKVKDNLGCEYTIPYNIILDPKPTEPTIKVETPVFNCDGTATSTVIVTNSTSNYSYQYLLDSVLNTNPAPNDNVFLNVPSGAHTVSVKYNVNSVSTYSNLLQEDFGTGGYTTTSGINPAYCFEDETSTHLVAGYKCNTDVWINDGEYAVASSIKTVFGGSWLVAKDHTTPSNSLGRFLCVNVGGTAGIGGILYSKPIKDVIINQPVIISLWAENLIKAANASLNDPKLTIQLVNNLNGVGGTETIVATTDTANPWVVPKSEKWEYKELSLNPGTYSNLSFVIRSYSNEFNGNDVLIDDIWVRQIPKSCITQKDFPILIDSNKALTASVTGSKDVSCPGSTDGEITIAVQNFDTTNGFQYSKDGITWLNATTSPVTLTNLAAGTYTPQVRYNNSGDCTLVLTPTIIKNPSPIVVRATATQATCLTDATVDATTTTGGSPAYSFQLINTVTAAVTNFPASGIVTNVPPGTYTVKATDAKLCTATLGSNLVIVATSNPTASLDVSSDFCYDTVDQAKLVVNASGGVGPYTYKLDTNAPQNTSTFSNVGVGIHSILVTDSNGCTTTISSIEIKPQLQLTAKLDQDLTCLLDASISATVSGGYGVPYTYTVSFNGGAPATVASFPYAATLAGTYAFTVSDTKGCPAVSNTITVSPKTTPTLTSTKTDISCNNANDGTITLTATAGFTSSYTYAIKLSSSATYTTQTTNQFTGLAAGIYDLKVIDSKGCESISSQVTITNPTPITSNATATSFSCSTTNSKQAALITVSPSGGSGTYTYSYNNGVSYGPSNTLTVNDNGSSQIFQIIVKDAKGCLSPMQTITLAPLNPPTISAITGTPIYCAPVANSTSTVTVATTTGTGLAPLTYTIESGPVTNTTGISTGIFNGLTAGTYTFKVTDANGCFDIRSYTVPAVTPIAVIATKLTDVDCFGNTTGSIRYNLSGFTSSYSYKVNTDPTITGQTAAVFILPNLGAATYNVVFTDETTGCTASTSITIVQPSAVLSATVAQVNANCFTPTSKVTVTPAGGTASYTYAYKQDGIAPVASDYIASNVANLNPATNLIWDVWVKDAKGCTVKVDVAITTDPIPSVTATATSQCLGVGSYTITAVGTGGVGTLVYSINAGGSYQTGNTFVVATSGSYTIRVKDANGCIADSNIITVAPQLTLGSVLNKGITCNLTPTDAQITLTAAGGTGPFTYESKEASGSYMSMASNVFYTGAAGSYTFRVTDTTTGCTAITTTPIVTTTPINPDITGVTQTQSINCNGDTTAAISITIDNTKGQSPFVFNVLNTTTGTNYGTQTSGLAAGDYTITVTDAKGCTDTDTIIIGQPTPIVINSTADPITCGAFGVSKGSVTIQSVTGGTAPYDYFITGKFYSNSALNETGGTVVFNIVDPGFYHVLVKDANGCTAVVTPDILVASDVKDLDITVTSPPPSCITGGEATVAVGAGSVNITGSGPFFFQIYTGTPQIYPAGTWLPEDVLFPKQATFTDLTPGVSYTFVIYDSITGCYFTSPSASSIPTNSSLTSSISTVNNVSCKGSANGNVSFDITSTYGVATLITYEVFDKITLTTTSISGSGTVPANGTLAITNVGPLAVGTYYVLIKEAVGATNAGCSIATAQFSIAESLNLLSISASVSKNSNSCVPNSGVITAIAKDGTGPYLYQIFPDTGVVGVIDATDNTTTDPTFSASFSASHTSNTFNKSQGNYVIYAKDAYGCIKEAFVSLVNDADPTIDPLAPICYDGSTPFTITLSGTVDPGIVGGATYSVNGSAFQTSPSFTFNAAATYNLVIKDGNGCTANVDYVVYPKLELSPSLTKELDCTTTPDAIITLTTTGGNTSPPPTYSYEVSTNGGGAWTPMATNVYSAVSDGTYDFRVTDANNLTTCQATTTFVLDPIVPTVFTTTETNVSCNGGNDGSIIVNVTSGVGPYEFKLDGPVSYPYQNSNQFDLLTAGTTYVVTVRDKKMCEYPSTPITITEPVSLTVISAITTPLTCGAGNAAQPATVTVNGVDGTAPYQYSFDGGANYSTTNTYQSYVGTTFDVFVKDANGCSYTLVSGVSIPALVPPSDLTFSTTVPVSCLVDATVDITGHIGGVGTLQYETIAPSPIIVPQQTTTTFAGLTPGTYLFQVTDANFCTYQESFTVNPVTNITTAGQIISQVTCFGAANGIAQFDVTNFAGNYNYEFDSAPVVNGVNTAQLTFNSLAPGLHTLVVTDATTGCTSTANVTISQPTAALDFTATATNINCNNDNATIALTAAGGTAPYTYAAVIAGSLATPVFGASNLITVDTNNGLDMNWIVYVKDNNGCSINKPQTIILDASPIITTVVATQCPSATGAYDITVTASGFSTLQYSLDGISFQNSNTITVNTSGSYTVFVKDTNGCISAPTSVTILAPLSLTTVVASSPTCADNDGVVTVSATGGSGNYVYNIDGGIFGAAAFNTVAAGSHSMGVRDTTTLCEVYVPINLKAATLITGFALATSPVSCYGGSDGTITATMATPEVGVNDNPIYMYTLSGTVVPRPAQASPLFEGLTVGTYTVLVTSERGCTDTKTIDVGQPNPIVIPVVTVVPFGCTSDNTGNLATISVSGVTGGSGTYLNYEFIKVGTPNTVVQFSDATTYTEANLLGGSYIVNVYDSNGCIGTTTAAITIDPYIALDKINVTVNQAITCSNLENITVTATSIGGAPANLEYTLVDSTGILYPIQTSANGIFTGLPVASYLITVTNLDTNCSIKGVHYVNQSNTFDLTIDNVVDIICFGGTNGGANVTIIDSATPSRAGAFSYTLVDSLGNVFPSGSSATDTATLTGLKAEVYTITATLSNTPYCSVSKSFTITGPTTAIKLTETHTEITCAAGNNDGTISATASGGWSGGYEYQLENGATVVTAWSAVTDFTGLTAATYTLKARDSRGCEDVIIIPLNNPTPIAINATANVSTLSCIGDTTGVITVNSTTGGQGSNYLYTLNMTSATPILSSGPQISKVFSGLGAGTYTISVTDGWGCSATTSMPITINQPTEIRSSLELASSQTCLTQATLKLSATGGTGLYSYSTTSNFAVIAGTFASSTIIPVSSGIYHYYVRDANGCSAAVSNDIEIAPIPTLTINLDITNATINCFGDNTGVIVAKAEGGLGSYVYTLLDSAGVAILPAPTQASPGIFTQLLAGTYKVNVVSGDCNETSALITISQPTTALVAPYVKTDVTCSGSANGQIVINASGGTGIIKYAISPNLDQFFETNTFKNLAPSTYTAIVQDVLGCYITFTFQIDEPLPLSAKLVAGSIIPEICSGDSDGEFTIEISGGTSAYKVSLDNQNGPFTSGVVSQTDFTFKNVSGGSHIVYIVDAMGCTSNLTVVLPDAVSLKPVAIIDYDCLNNLPSNTVTVKVDSSILPADVDYALDGIAPFQASNVFSNVSAGTHFISARHTNGCIQKTQNFTMLQINPLAVNLINGGLNEIVATTTGGSGSYHYTFNGANNGTSNTYIYYSTGDYTVEVVDSEGCTATDTKLFTFIDINIPNVFTPNGDGNNDTWGPTNTTNYPDIVYHVYDRYGRIVGTYHKDQFWDGKYNGLELPSGDYWYTLKLNNDKDAREFVGHFTLYR